MKSAFQKVVKFSQVLFINSFF